MIRKFKGRIVSIIAGSLAVASQAKAQVPAEIEAMVDDSISLFTLVKGFVVSVVVFGILIGIVKMLKKK